MHYCMNRFDSLKFYTAESDYCGRCGMHTKDHGCCHDEVTIVKLDNDHQTTQFNFSPDAPSLVADVRSEFVQIYFPDNNKSTDHLNHSPPLLSRQDTYLQNCVFRI